MNYEASWNSYWFRQSARNGSRSPRSHARHSGAAVAAQTQWRPGIERIALIPIEPPIRLHVKESAFFSTSIVPTGQQAKSRRKQRIFQQKLDVARGAMGEKLTGALLHELAAAGFKVSLLDGVKRTPDDMDGIDFTTLTTLDAPLHVTFSDVGMYRRHPFSDFEPRVNARAFLKASPDAKGWVTGDYFFYGVDARGDMDWTIPSEPKYRYASWDALLDGADAVAESFERAIDAIAQRITRQLRAQL